MCFSAEASLASGAAVGAVGIATLTKVRYLREVPLGVLPLLFAVHQVQEGMVWLALEGRLSPLVGQWFVWLYVLFAHAFLIALAPWSIWLVEPDPKRRRLLVPFLILGTCLCGFALWKLSHGQIVAQIRHQGIEYDDSVTTLWWFAVLYVAATCAAFPVELSLDGHLRRIEPCRPDRRGVVQADVPDERVVCLCRLAERAGVPSFSPGTPLDGHTGLLGSVNMALTATPGSPEATGDKAGWSRLDTTQVAPTIMSCSSGVRGLTTVVRQARPLTNRAAGGAVVRLAGALGNDHEEVFVKTPCAARGRRARNAGAARPSRSVRPTRPSRHRAAQPPSGKRSSGSNPR